MAKVSIKKPSTKKTKNLPKKTVKKPLAKPRASTSRAGKVPQHLISRLAPVSVLEEEGIHLSVYGRSGSGKTTLISTFPKPMVLIDCHAGTRSISDVDGIERFKLEDPEEVREITKVQNSSEPWQTVVLDHATRLQDLVIQKILNLDEAPAQLSWGTATQQQWGQVSSGMCSLLRDLVQLSCNVVIVSQERAFNADETSELLIPNVSSALTPGATGYLTPAMDYVGQTFLREYLKTVTKTVGGKEVKRQVPEIQYCFRTGPHPVYATKFRSPRGYPMPNLIINPTFQKIVKVIEGKPLPKDSMG